jgi:hypothetical protein
MDKNVYTYQPISIAPAYTVWPQKPQIIPNGKYTYILMYTCTCVLFSVDIFMNIYVIYICFFLNLYSISIYIYIYIHIHTYIYIYKTYDSTAYQCGQNDFFCPVGSIHIYIYLYINMYIYLLKSNACIHIYIIRFICIYLHLYGFKYIYSISMWSK